MFEFNNNFELIWTKDKNIVRKYFNKDTIKYFDYETIPRFLVPDEKENPRQTFGIAVDKFNRAIGGLIVGFKGHGPNNYNISDDLPYIWEICAASKKGIPNVAAPCEYAQKGVGTTLVKIFAEKVNYNFWFTCADLKIATPFWQGIVNRIPNIKLAQRGTTPWGTPVYEISKL